jgi:multidrug resistance efflux pump
MSEDDKHNDSTIDEKQQETRRATLIILAIILLLFIWYLVSDRLTPSTASVRIKAFVVEVVPDISGYVAEIPVKKNQLVETGGTLLQVEKRRFEIALESAEAALELAGQSVGADTAAVSTATAKLTAAQAQLDEARLQGVRVFGLAEKGVISQAKADEGRKLIKTAEAQVAAATSEVERAKQLLGGDVKDNPRIRAALAALDVARLNLERTTIRAPGQGYVGGLKIDNGAYVSAGQSAMTFIALDDIWVEAYMTENQLSNVQYGDEVELAFDAFAGQIFEGKVKSIGAGVSTGKKADRGDLSTIEKTSGWLRAPQRFPVIIDITNYDIDVNRSGGLRLNSQADVIVYTGDHTFWNALGWVWIRFLSLLSYAY